MPKSNVMMFLTNPNIGRRTGLDVKAGKNIRRDEDGMEVFDDYWTDPESENDEAKVGSDSEEKIDISSEKMDIPEYVIDSEDDTYKRISEPYKDTTFIKSSSSTKSPIKQKSFQFEAINLLKPSHDEQLSSEFSIIETLIKTASDKRKNLKLNMTPVVAHLSNNEKTYRYPRSQVTKDSSSCREQASYRVDSTFTLHKSTKQKTLQFKTTPDVINASGKEVQSTLHTQSSHVTSRQKSTPGYKWSKLNSVNFKRSHIDNSSSEDGTSKSSSYEDTSFVRVQKELATLPRCEDADNKDERSDVEEQKDAVSNQRRTSVRLTTVKTTCERNKLCSQTGDKNGSITRLSLYPCEPDNTKSTLTRKRLKFDELSSDDETEDTFIVGIKSKNKQNVNKLGKNSVEKLKPRNEENISERPFSFTSHNSVLSSFPLSPQTEKSCLSEAGPKHQNKNNVQKTIPNTSRRQKPNTYMYVSSSSDSEVETAFRLVLDPKSSKKQTPALTKNDTLGTCLKSTSIGDVSDEIIKKCVRFSDAGVDELIDENGVCETENVGHEITDVSLRNSLLFNKDSSSLKQSDRSEIDVIKENLGVNQSQENTQKNKECREVKSKSGKGRKRNTRGRKNPSRTSLKELDSLAKKNIVAVVPEEVTQMEMKNSRSEKAVDDQYLEDIKDADNKLVFNETLKKKTYNKEVNKKLEAMTDTCNKLEKSLNSEAERNGMNIRTSDLKAVEGKLNSTNFDGCDSPVSNEDEKLSDSKTESKIQDPFKSCLDLLKYAKGKNKKFNQVSSTEKRMASEDFSSRRPDPIGAEENPKGCPKIIKRGLKRTTVKPVAFWRNERVDYRRTSKGTYEVAGILPGFQEDSFFTQKGKKSRNKQQALFKHNLSIHDRQVLLEKDMQEELYGGSLVNDPELGREVKAVVVRSHKALSWRGPTGFPAKDKDSFRLCKSFQLSNFSMGILVLGPLQEKPCQFAHADSLFFTVIYGKVEAHVHDSSWIFETDGSFLVPLGNTYSVRNLQKKEAKLIFFTIKGSPPVEELMA